MKKLVLLAAIASTLLLIPSTASAAVTCNFAGGTVDIDATAATSFVTVQRGTGGAANDIIVFDGNAQFGTPVNCGTTPTVTTADTVTFDSTLTNSGGTLSVDLANGPFSPGAAGEAGTSDEIEFTLTGGAGTDQFNVVGSSGPENIRIGGGAAGVVQANLNGSESDGIDVDVDATSINRIFADGAGGDDTITGDGSGGTPAITTATSVTTQFAGGTENDTLRSGTGNSNSLDGEGGNDTMTGNTNSDSIDVDLGDDTADGGGGSDAASYLNHNQGVTVDLRVTTPQNTIGAGTDTLANFEILVGSNESDTLIGTEGPDQLLGGQLSNDTGNDTIIGHGGADALNGGPGDDTLIGGQGDDTFTGAQGTDTVSYASGATGPVTLSLALANTGVQQNTGGAGLDTLLDSAADAGTDHDVENITGSAFGGDVLTGNGLANLLIGHGDSLADTIDCVASGDGDTAILDEVGIDSASNCETVDTAPQTSVASGPANGATIADTTPTYELVSDEVANFGRSIDGGQYSACSPSCTLPALSDGTHTIKFVAVDNDESGFPDPTPATRTVTIDTTAPAVQIDSRPAESSNDTTPSWTFSSDDPAATYECKLDGEAFGACADTGGHTATVSEGAHTFSVRATDPLGHATVASDDFAVALDQVNVDGDAPDSKLGAVKKKTTKRRVNLSFSSTDATAHFECSLDGAPFAACSSPYRTPKLKPGKHRFQVRAIDPAGNVGAAASAQFKVKKKRRR